MEVLDRLKNDLANSADWNVTITVSKKDLENLAAYEVLKDENLPMRYSSSFSYSIDHPSDSMIFMAWVTCIGSTAFPRGRFFSMSTRLYCLPMKN